MKVEKLGMDVGACGRCCFSCRWIDRRLCRGCPEENALLPEDDQCIIFKCVRKKGVKHCLQCEEMPCQMRKELNGSYCPVYAKHHEKFAEYVEKNKE